MGKTEAERPSKSEKPTSPTQDQTSGHAYPNWAAMQAYYPGMTIPPQYFNTTVASGHPPHPFMWGTPQHMMPPYGTPYAAIYAPGGVYPHPSVSLGLNSVPVVRSSTPMGEAMVETPLTMATPAKSSSNKDQGLTKKLKGFGGLVVSLGNGGSGTGSGEASHSHSGDYKTEGSSDGSNGNTGKEKPRRKRSCDDMASPGEDDKVEAIVSPKVGGVASTTPNTDLGITVLSTDVVGHPVAPSVTTKTITANFPPASGADGVARDGLATGLWNKSERELKRERRKQSNRESARRSRLRKQAETEDLAVKVESLNTENLSLRSELSRLSEKSEKLRLENAALKEKLKSGQLGRATENFLSKVNNSGSDNGSRGGETEVHENSNSSRKLHQLLKSSPRSDTVVAG